MATRNDTVDRDGRATGLYVENGDPRGAAVDLRPGPCAYGRHRDCAALLALAESGRSVGDTLPVIVSGVVRDLRNVGTYQAITNGGKTAKSPPTKDAEVMWIDGRRRWQTTE